MTLTLFVPGVPQTQGGMRQVPTVRGNRQISTGSKDLGSWRAAITELTGWRMNLQRWQPITEAPVRVELEFFLPMPKSARASLRTLGVAYHTARKDIDKLERAVLDSLTRAGVYGDDSQVAVLVASKYQVADHRLVGVLISVGALGRSSDMVLVDALSRVSLAAS